MRLCNYLSVSLICMVFLLNAKTVIDLPCFEVSVSNNRGVAEFSARELFGEPGQPELPVYTASVLLPPDADMSKVTLIVEDVRETVLSGSYEVKAALPPMSQDGPEWPPNRTIIYGIDVDVYSTDLTYPVESITFVEFGKLNIYKIVDVRINLVRYNPVTKTLYQLTNGKLVIDVKKESGYSTSRNTNKLIPSAIKNRTKKLVVNYDEYAALYNRDYTFSGAKVMAIITTDAIKNGSQKFTAFVESKKRRGIDTKIVTETDMGGNSAENIRKWLQDNYQGLGLMYLLLIGNSIDGIPMMTFTEWTGDKSCPSDWPYAQLTGDFKSDKKCELHVGRIPVYDNDLTTMDAILQKTIDYENTSEKDAQWRKNILLLGPGWASGTNMACTYLNPVHEEFVLETPGWKSYRLYGKRYGQPTGLAPDQIVGNDEYDVVAAQWKSGDYGVIDFATHGNATTAQDIILSKHTASMINEKQGFVLCAACSNAEPKRTDNLSYSLLRDCAIGSIAGTDATYYGGGGSYQTSGNINGWCYRYGQFLIADTMEIGVALTALREMDPGFLWYNRAPFVLYGDPSIGVTTYSREPFISVLSPNGAEEWEQGTTQEIMWSDNIDGNVKIELLKGSSVKEELAASTESDGSFEWKIPGDFEKGNDFKIKITSVDSNVLIDESNAAFSIVEEYLVICPYFQNFDTLESGSTTLPYKYEQATDDDLNWIVLAGPTPSRVDDPPDVTGAEADHTTGTNQGNYIYTEASNNGNPGKKFTYLTPKFNFKSINSPKLSFWYHMFSDNAGEDHMGDLILDISVDGTWQNDVIKISGNKGDNWLEQTLDLTPYMGDRVIFRFRGVTGDSWESDICIDDLKIDGTIPITNSITKIPFSYDLKYNGTRICFQVPNKGINFSFVTLKLYNLQGKLVSTLVNRNVKAGYHSLSLGKALDGEKSPAAGLYLCTMKAGKFTKTINMILKK